METGFVSETLVCIYKTAHYCNTKKCNVKFFRGLTSAMSVLWIDHSVDSTVGHVCNDMQLFVMCCKFLVTPQSCRVCRSGILYHATNLSHSVLHHISWDTFVYISEFQSGCVEQNLILCALQTLVKTKTYPLKTISGLWMSLQGCFYYMYVSWVMWGICPAYHGYVKQAWECPNQKTVFHSHVLVDTNSHLINVEVWMSEGGKREEKESTTWV